MKTVQMTIDDDLLTEVDRAVHNEGTTRSAFIREALEAALRRLQIVRLERAHAAGYARQPVAPDETDEWDADRVWGET